MASSALRIGLAALSFAVSRVAAQDTSPGGPTQPNIAANCNAWHTVVAGDGCWAIENQYGISHADFIKWNPDVSDDCTTNFWGGYAYCVGVSSVASTTSQTSTSSSTASSSSTISSSISSSTSSSLSTLITSSSLTVSSAVATANATYSIREPIYTWNITTTTVESTFPPQKTQAGQPTYCNNWYFVRPGDTCASIAASTTWMSLTDLLKWNPALDSDCSGLYVDWWICIGIQPQSVTASFEYITSAPAVVVPNKTADYTPTTFPAVDSSFTASPTQAGVATNCQAFYQAQSGDTCRQVLAYNIPTQEEFFAWNPALNGNCNGLWAGYWYCVAAYPSGYIPMPPAVTTSPSPVPTGQTSTCSRWYLTTSDETCDDIVAGFTAFSKADFIAWNPSVGSNCAGIKTGLYYCVGIPGTPTTRTSAVSTTTVPTETPTQSGIASDCSQLWLVASTDTCASIAAANGITEIQLYTWNPAVGTSSCTNLTPNFYVCVAVRGLSSSASVSVTSGPTTTTTSNGSTVLSTSSSTTSAPSTTSASSTTSDPSTTTSSGGTVSTPVPVQNGMVAGCRRFYMAQSGDGCWAIANSAGIALSDFYSWNTAVDTNCGGLWPNYWYCIGIAGPVTSISSGPPVPT